MEAKCPKCHTRFDVKSDCHVRAGKARAKLWTKEQRSEAMKRAWEVRKAKQREKDSTA